MNSRIFKRCEKSKATRLQNNNLHLVLARTLGIFGLFDHGKEVTRDELVNRFAMNHGVKKLSPDNLLASIIAGKLYILRVLKVATC